MEETRYMISDAAKQIDVESHVLRYWEEELEIEIPRNEMGHRYYREADIITMRAVKRLKDQGYQLKLIKMLLPEIEKIEQLENGKLMNLREQLELVTGISGTAEVRVIPQITEQSMPEPVEKAVNLIPGEVGSVPAGIDKMQQFREIMGAIVSEAVVKNNARLTKNVSDSVSERVIKEMDYLMRVREEKEEEHYRQIDRLLRERGKGKKEIAVTKEKRRKEKRQLWKRSVVS